MSDNESNDSSTKLRTGPPRSIARTKARKKARSRRIISVSLVVLFLLVLLLGWFYYTWAESAPNTTESVYVVVEPNDTLSGIVSKLASSGAIKSDIAFRVYMQLHQPPTLHPGTYSFKKPSSFASVYDTIKGGPIMKPLIIPPGLTLAQVADKVGMLPGHSAADFLKLELSNSVRSPYEPTGVNSLEGLLGTATYDVVPGESDLTLLTDMVNEFSSLARQAGMTTNGTDSNSQSTYQVIITASIVREEAGIPSDGPKVARVILNRLAANMALQMDSTVRYAIGDPSRPPNLQDLKVNSPYNTYLYKGLPPTPIATVDISDLKDVLYPATGNWLYFVVVSKNGAEAFADTYQQQLANEAIAKAQGLIP
ncbi:MAG: endolytic transglycosylase MltG [Acidimicrobiales bacterium]|nr:endolytic transglycosylase MltG [Acidimicrobiales bacterium]